MLERARVGLIRTDVQSARLGGHMWTEKDTLGWMRNAYGVKRGLKRASLYLEGHSIFWKGHMCSSYAYTLRDKAYVDEAYQRKREEGVSSQFINYINSYNFRPSGANWTINTSKSSPRPDDSIPY